MAAASVNEKDFIALFEKHGGKGTADILGIALRNVMGRRAGIEKRRGVQIKNPKPRNTRPLDRSDAPLWRSTFEVETGHVIIGSDAHYWPGRVSTAHRAFVKLIGDIKPKAVIVNGDMVDGASISRHPPLGHAWEQCPSVIEEIETTQDRLHEIEKAAGKAHKFWNLGNHDQRFEMRLATSAREYAELKGFRLRDHFPLWQSTMATWINDAVVVKHRFKGGVHATHNNTVSAGKSIVTGHLHSLKVTPYTDYNGDRWGVDTGTMAEPNGDQFVYGEDNPKNHRSGFAVLTFHKGRLLWPDVVHVISEDEVTFQGKVIKV